MWICSVLPAAMLPINSLFGLVLLVSGKVILHKPVGALILGRGGEAAPVYRGWRRRRFTRCFW